MVQKDKKQKSVPEREEEILKFWEENRIFEKTLEKTEKGKPFVFYEGPPTANGMPGIHHIEARAFKDAIPRFKTMQGFFVPRKAGWDTHGLPVEIQVEKELGFKSKQDIENYGIGKFNAKAKESVWRYKEEWERLTKRMAFWMDLDHPYMTYETSYIESLWWVIKEFWKKGLLYEDFKVVPWCPRCGTALSSHEVGLGYQEDEDMAVFVKFKLKPGQKIGDFITDDNTYILSWTTTPWTLPGNVGLAVNKKFDYVLLVNPHSGERIIIAKRIFLLASDPSIYTGYLMYMKPTSSKEGEIKGETLVGLSYEPLFDVSELQNEKSHTIYAADFVTAEDGTGVVHTAVMYGEDDYKLGNEIGLPKFHTVTEDGKFISDLKGLAGLLVKAKETEEKIIQILGDKIFHREKYKHEYPHCWRCQTPLLYYARRAWWVKTTAVKEKLLENNETIDWIPEHIQHGRFGEFLRDVRDWAFSRERYWGTPLPVWKCSGCTHKEVLGSLEELREKAVKGKNTYILLRHGESLANVKNVVSSGGEKHPLTVRGKKQAESAAKKLKNAGIDIIYSSPIRRAKETAGIIVGELGIKKEDWREDERLREIDAGTLSGKSIRDYRAYFATARDHFIKRPPGHGAENLRDVESRVGEFIAEMEKTHTGKTILIVSHECPIRMLWAQSKGLTDEEIIGLRTGPLKKDFMGFAETKKTEYLLLPRNGEGELDLHRPFIDSFSFSCKECGAEMKRTPEVADVWFDSGGMPFAQGHFPFNKKEKLLFPADFICEAVDQTRGWFYSMLAVATLLGKSAPYKHVISLGHVLDKNGQKMSKSRGNIVNPWEMIEKFGIDALRWYFYTINAPGDPKRFDEKDIGQKLRSFIGTFWNCFLFFDTYSARITNYELRITKKSAFLDKWILLRLDMLTKEMTDCLETYDVVGAARALEQFVINDFSQWYVKHSRRRLQNPETKKEKEEAGTILGEVLSSIARLSAPFTPFLAESVWQGLGKKMPLKEESVHLAPWPFAKKKGGRDTAIIKDMELLQTVASDVLRMRAEAGISLRQPLGALSGKGKVTPEFADLLKQVVNVKEITIGNEWKLDTVLTPALKEEGMLREFVRNVQEMRKELGLTPKDVVTLFFEGGASVEEAVLRNQKQILRDVRAKAIQKGKKKTKSEREISFSEGTLWVGIE